LTGESNAGSPAREKYSPEGRRPRFGLTGPDRNFVMVGLRETGPGGGQEDEGIGPQATLKEANGRMTAHSALLGTRRED